MKIAIIGGGISGLTAAYGLTNQGHEVKLYETSGVLGGQASTFNFSGVRVEGFYHFICGGDKNLVSLLEQLGIGSSLHWSPTKTAFFYNGRLHPFSNALDLIRFTPISFLSRIRFGLGISYSKFNKNWQKYDHIPGVDWLTRQIGRQAYEVIWHPLLKIKFGEDYDKISAAWVWHRIHRVSESRKTVFSPEYMGYLEGGSETLMNALGKAITAGGGEICLKANVNRILLDQSRKVSGLIVNGEKHDFDLVFSTVPLPQLIELLPDEADQLKARLAKIKFIGVVCMILKLRRPITDIFWLNINDPDISFNGIIEYTNLNKSNRFGDYKIAYIPFYLATSEPRFHYSNEQIFEEYIQAIKRVSPQFSPDWVADYRVFRHRYAQAVCTTNFARMMEGPRSPFKGLYFTDSTQIYPTDRCLSGLIGNAWNALEMIKEDYT